MQLLVSSMTILIVIHTEPFFDTKSITTVSSVLPKLLDFIFILLQLTTFFGYSDFLLI